MPTKKSQPVEVNSFVKGLITEASPLNFPPDATTAEQNFTLNKDGTRQRRRGIDYEDDWAYQDSLYGTGQLADASVNTFLWANVAESSSLSIAVIQIGNKLHMHESTTAPLSSTKLGVVTIGTFKTVRMSFASVDGDLVVVNGDGNIYTVSYNSTLATFSTTSSRIKVRDLFGVEDLYTPVGREELDLTDGGNVSYRPLGKQDNHLYNLRNQSWGVARPIKGYIDGSIGDCIAFFTSDTGYTDYGVYPSNADVQHQHVRVDDADDQLEERFFPRDAQKQPPYHLPAAKGYFIIDALERGISRTQAYQDNMLSMPSLTLDLEAPLNDDVTPGGATQVAEYAGRIWYGGFSGEVQDGDSKSPKLSSYVMFSQLVQQPTDATKCYQVGDPTGPDTSDLVATDGGFIRISGMDQFISFLSIDQGLFVLASNGVWRIAGGNDEGFNATNPLVTKVAKQPTVSRDTVLEVDNTVLYWSEDGVYQIAPDAIDHWAAQSISQGTIQTYYNTIPDKDSVKGFYDSVSREARWVFTDGGVDKELILDTVLGAWRLNVFSSLSETTPRIAGYIVSEPFSTTVVSEEIYAGTDQVFSSSDAVVIDTTVTSGATQEAKYLTLFDNGVGNISYTFSAIKDATWTDWVSADGVGADAAGFLNTGDITGGDSSMRKQVPYLTFHMRRTEDGFDENFQPTNASSCLGRVQWNFSNSPAAGQWGREIQLYKHRRGFQVLSSSDAYDDGYALITTRNKLRGRGRAFSLYLQTEPGKDCQIVGWNLSLNGNANV